MANPKKSVEESVNLHAPAVEIATGLIAEDQLALVQQHELEFPYSKQFMESKWPEWGSSLKLYNNQRKNKKSVGDTLFYSTFQTILSAVYDDKLQVEFLPREEGDIGQAENVNFLAKYDYDVMEKDKLDLHFDWDAFFFGRALVSMMEFDREKLCVMPELIDPLTWYRDPMAESVNGDAKGVGAMRFGGRDKFATMDSLEKDPNFFDVAGLKPSTTVANDRQKIAKEERHSAQGFSSNENLEPLGGGSENIPFREWFTIFKGKRVYVCFAEDGVRIIRYKVLKQQKYWPIVDRVYSPIPHDWDGVSVRDLCEDKQRARAVLKNLSLKGAELSLYPSFAYNALKLKNRGDLNVQFNKHIPVDGDPSGVIQPLSKPQPVNAGVDWIMKQMDADAQDATATSNIQQGNLSEGKKSALEIDIANSKSTARSSLTALVLGWSEKEFWRQWYQMYKDFFDDEVDTKVVRIKGMMGLEWRGFKKDDFMGKKDPDIEVESRVVVERERGVQLVKFTNFRGQVLNNPDVNLSYLDKELARLSGMRQDQIARVFPQTYEEMLAEQENKDLNDGNMPKISIRDDHEAHIEIHNRALDGDEKERHINQHKEALLLVKRNAEMLPPEYQAELQQKNMQKQEIRTNSQVQQNIDYGKKTTQ